MKHALPHLKQAEPEEIGNAAAFLVSAKNSYMTGTTVEVCGGFNRYL
jgi:NAD(P)-dependent dehydrogenase (short-subunit alcohol dehydrogenase family)